LLEPDDASVWSRTITGLLQDSELEQRMIEASLQRASEFSWRRCAEQTIKAYEYALGHALPRKQ
jgi:glycosyltransferase involved in cell wall biosynthesis